MQDCIICGQASNFRCSKCRQASYCSVEHQKNDWKRHKHICSLVGNKKESTKRTLENKTAIDSCVLLFREALREIATNTYNQTCKLLQTTPQDASNLERYVFIRCKFLNELFNSSSRHILNKLETIIVESVELCNLLISENTKYHDLIKTMILWISVAFSTCVPICHKELLEWSARVYGAFPTPKLHKCLTKHCQPLIDVVENTKNTPFTYTMKAEIPPMLRSSEVMLEGQSYFQHLISQSKYASKICIKRSDSSGFSVIAQQDISSNQIVFAESSFVCASLDLDGCYHCTLKYDEGYSWISCRKNCGLRYCSVYCEEQAFMQYHESLCSVWYTSTYETMCKKLCESAQSSSGKFSLLFHKMLGMQLKLPATSNLYDVPPLKYLFPFHMDIVRKQDLSEQKQNFVLSGFANSTERILKLMAYCSTPTNNVHNVGLDWITRLTAYVMTNSFTFRVKNEKMLRHAVHGSAICLGTVTSLFNHNCIPNAAFHFLSEPGQIAIITTRSVRKGEEICISYCDTDGDDMERKTSLLRTYCFNCTCLKCNCKR